MVKGDASNAGRSCALDKFPKKEVVVGLVALKILWGGFSGSYHIVILG